MVDVTGRILVPFEGEGSGVAELAWGQQEIWSAMVRQRWWLPIGAIRPVPAGTTLDDVVAELRFMMGRYQTMRTRLRFDPDGRTRQVVAGSGEVPLEIVDAEPGADPADVAEQARQRYWDIDYDFVHDWPVRTAVIRRHGVPTHLVTVLCHLVTDGFGAAAMLAELASRDRKARETKVPLGAMQPLEQVRWQRSPAGQRQCATVLRHWEGLLRTISAHRFAGSADPRRPRHWQAGFTSPAMHLAVRAIADRTTVDASPLLLAVFAVALARVTGINPVVVQVVVSNRFRPGLAGTVSPVNQTGLCVLDVAGISLDEVIARTARKTLNAYKHAYYDPQQLDKLVERVSRERGEDLDIACYFNDRRIQVRDRPAGPVPTAGQIRAALPHSVLRWERQQDKPWERLFVHIENVPDTVAVTICADTHYVSPADMEACVRGMEAVAVEAALDAGAPTRVPPRRVDVP